jgi:hypothetical protein
MPHISCEGCNAQLKRSGLYPHLRLSQNQKCKEYLNRLTYEQVEPLGSDNDNDNDKAHWPFQLSNADDIAVDPVGDFFGDYNDYTAEEFGMDVDEGKPSEGADEEEADEEVEDTELEATLAEEENGLEPERKMKPEPPIQLQSTEPTLLDPTTTRSAQRLRGGAEGPLQNRPYIVKFGGKAGAVFERGAEDANGQYLEGLGDENNLYAPFGSKLEWEIARWAKLRGPSSTAFTELMAIEGVGTLSNTLNFVAKLTKDI